MSTRHRALKNRPGIARFREAMRPIRTAALRPGGERSRPDQPDFFFQKTANIFGESCAVAVRWHPWQHAHPQQTGRIPISTNGC
jgi:hypothetical protein